MDGLTSSGKKERTVEEDVYFEEVRKHVVAIVGDLGQALFITLNPALGNVLGCWQNLANSICDFGEFLDNK